MENPQFVQVKRDLLLSNLIELDDDNKANELLEYLRDMISDCDTVEKDGVTLHHINNDHKNWRIFKSDEYMVIRKDIYDHFLRIFHSVDVDGVKELIKIGMNIVFETESVSLGVENMEFADFYYRFFFNENITTHQSLVRKNMVKIYSATS